MQSDIIKSYWNHWRSSIRSVFISLGMQYNDGLLHQSFTVGIDDILDENVQISGLMQPSSAQNWLSSQGSSSGLIVKRTIRVDIPVEKYPNV